MDHEISSMMEINYLFRKLSKVKIWTHFTPQVDHIIPKILDEMQRHVFKIGPESQHFI